MYRVYLQEGPREYVDQCTSEQVPHEWHCTFCCHVIGPNEQNTTAGNLRLQPDLMLFHTILILCPHMHLWLRHLVTFPLVDGTRSVKIGKGIKFFYRQLRFSRRHNTSTYENELTVLCTQYVLTQPHKLAITNKLITGVLTKIICGVYVGNFLVVI